MQIGLDIGSTTIKIAVLDDAGKLLFAKYQRHYSQITEKIQELLQELLAKFPLAQSARLAVSGSAGLGIAEGCGLQFVQEVFAEKVCTERLKPETDVVIELGGEDAKILFLGKHFDARMNDSCAGGTGAFIDQMATLLNVATEDMDEMAKQAKNIYTIADRGSGCSGDPGDRSGAAQIAGKIPSGEGCLQPDPLPDQSGLLSAHRSERGLCPGN